MARTGEAWVGEAWPSLARPGHVWTGVALPGLARSSQASPQAWPSMAWPCVARQHGCPGVARPDHGWFIARPGLGVLVEFIGFSIGFMILYKHAFMAILIQACVQEVSFV